jgi:bacterioferritin (cytochrome b1)
MEKSINDLLVQQKIIAENTEPSSVIVEEEIKQIKEHPENLTQAQNYQGYSSDTVIELIKKSLSVHWQQTTELTAQAEHLERWGYKKLAAIFKEDAIQEQTHAAINLKRLEFFDIDYQPLILNPPTWKRHDMVSMIQYNLNSVREASAAERATIVAARAVGDEITANMFIELLQGSEDGIQLYEGFLKLIEQMGVDNFLTLQV